MMRRGPYKTHCKHGHPYTPENTLWSDRSDRGRQRRCRICAQEQDRRRYRIKAAEDSKFWNWETGRPSERAEMVRRHYGAVGLTNENVCELFHLTPEGLKKIARGDIWRPEYEAAPLAQTDR